MTELTVRAILDLEILSGAQLLIGGDESLGRPVSGITVMEAPDIEQWLKGGELVLTSLYSVATDVARQRQLVRALASKGAAALIVKLHRFVDDLAPEVTAEAQAVQLPIVQISPELRFVDILSAVMSELLDHQYRLSSYYRQCHEIFTQLSLDNAGVSVIAKALQGMIGAPVLVVDSWQVPLAQADDEQNLVWDIEQGCLIDDHTHDPVPQQQHSLRLMGQNRAALVVAETAKRLTDLDRVAVESAATVISLQLLKELAVQEAEQRFEADLLDEIIRGHATADHVLLKKVSQSGLSPAGDCYVIAIRLAAWEHYLQQDGQDDQSDHLTQYLSRLQRLLHAVLTRSNKSALSRVGPDQIVILWQGRLEERVELRRIKSFLQQLQTALRRELPEIKAAAGVSELVHGLHEVGRALKEALSALSIAEMLHGSEGVAVMGELGIYRLLCSLGDLEQLRQYIPGSLRRLLDYDHHHHTSLTETLEVFLKHQGNGRAAAQAMFIHYKTLLYRLRRIREITKIDLDRHDESLELQVGLAIWRLLAQQ